jgi:formate dehydrogenase major subunit
MKLSRRGFLKVTGAATTGAVLGGFAFSRKAVQAYAQTLRTQYAEESTTICPYCAVGCGMIVSVSRGKVINIEGDPDHPVNQGSLCSKGSALFQVANNDRRMTKILYRAPYSDRWEEKSWDWTISRIAENIKKTRDASWTAKDATGQVVNRTEAVAGLGGAALDNEECYLWSKLARALGIVYLEHQARI